MTTRSISWEKYLYFSIAISSRLKELECLWRQPQSDMSLINWYIKQVLGSNDPQNIQFGETSFEEYSLMISKAIEDGMIQVVGSYQDPIDGVNVRLLKSNKLFFPEIWS